MLFFTFFKHVLHDSNGWNALVWKVCPNHVNHDLIISKTSEDLKCKVKNLEKCEKSTKFTRLIMFYTKYLHFP